MSNITNFNFNGADVRQSKQSAYRDIGFVYVVEDAAAGRVKIGMSSKPEQRIRSVRSSAGISGGRSYTSVRAKDAAALEAAIHQALSGSRLHGEFFGCSFEDAVSVVSSMSESSAADDDYVRDRLAEQEERSRSTADGFRRMLCSEPAADDFSEEQRSRLTHARNFASVKNSTIGDLLAVAEWAMGGSMSVLDRSKDEESFFCFDGLVGEIEPVTVAAIYRAIAYAGQVGVVYGGGRDSDDGGGLDSEVTVGRDGALRA